MAGKLFAGSGEAAAGISSIQAVGGHIVKHEVAAFAVAVARKAGVASLILGDSLEGEAREVGFVMAGIALQARRFGQPIAPPCVLISGGETTVTVTYSEKK